MNNWKMRWLEEPLLRRFVVALKARWLKKQKKMAEETETIQKMAEET